MPNAPTPRLESFQAQFHRRWNHLNNPHVRALAWLLDSPDLLDVHAPQWRGKIASLAGHDVMALHDWLTSLDQDPAQLQAAVDNQPSNRLGRYAEQLMAFYFRHQGVLVGHGVQVQDGKNGTVGEFDFLLRDHDALVHWEFATKFYLLESNCFVGPNLADTLGAKMHKILDQQLTLAQHPAAQIHLPQSVTTAAALIKGWLFYHEQNQYQDAIRSNGLTSMHCRGFWCTLSEWAEAVGECVVILPRLQWLAPVKISIDQALNRTMIGQVLRDHFAHDSMPLLVAILERQGECGVETSRGFIVADDWPGKAQQYLQRVETAGS